MRKIIFIILPIALFVLSSCGGSNDGDFTVECTYLKARAGSTWKYEITQGTSVTTQTSVASSVTEVENTELIIMKSTANGVEQESYLTCDDSKLIQSAPSAQTLGGQTVNDILLTLDLGKPIGEQYLALNISQDLSQDGTSFISKNDYFGKVLEKDLSMTVSGTAYTDIVKFGLTAFSESIINGSSQGVIETGTTIYYIAPEAGNIYTETEFLGEIINTVTLLEYNY